MTVALPAFASAQPNADPNALTVITADGQTVTGTWESLNDETLTLGGETPQRFRTADLRLAEFRGRGVAPIHRGSLVLLANGDRLAARPLRMDEETLNVAWTAFPHWKPVAVPLEALRGVVLKVPEISTLRRQLLAAVTDEQAASDVVILENRDQLAGVLLGMDETSVTLESAVGKTSLERDGVRAVGFNPELADIPDVTGPHALLVLTDGSQLTVRNLALPEGGPLTAETVFGQTLELPRAAVASLRFLGGRVTYLSDLEPVEYRMTPYLSTPWTLARNRSVGGGALQLRGTEYPRGLGLHSRSAVSYDLGGRYQSFEAVAGIDDETHGEGHVTLAVEVDGERIFTSGPVTGRTPPLAVGPLDVTGKQRLTLIVEYGRFGDIQDHADWCDAVLIAPPR